MMRALLVCVAAVSVAGCGHRGLVVDWSFKNIEDGYDHASRIDVYVDGEKFVESPAGPQSVPSRLPVGLPAGAHDVKIVAMALWEGQWEEHTIANNYSIDCLWEGKVSGSERLKLVFDLDRGTIAR